MEAINWTARDRETDRGREEWEAESNRLREGGGRDKAGKELGRIEKGKGL